MNELKVICPTCGAVFFVETGYLGHMATCTECQADLPIRYDPSDTAGFEHLLLDDDFFEMPGFGLRFRLVRAGSFLQGSDSGYAEQRPVRRTYVTTPFWIADTPTTQRAYERVMHYNPSHTKGPDRPVEHVTWHQALDYCYCLTEQARIEGLLPEHTAFRLPTEAEWEMACRWPIEPESGTAARLAETAWFRNNSDGAIRDVAGREPNHLGLYDMLGNVREWCTDWCAPYFPEDTLDPWGPETGTRKVLRGGSYMAVISRCQPADRIACTPDFRCDAIGFRPVLAQG